MGVLSIPSALQLHRRKYGQRSSQSSAKTPPPSYTRGNSTSQAPTKEAVRQSTRTRKFVSDAAAWSYLLSLTFLILICIGNINGSTVLGQIYFFRLELSNIFPASTPNAALINSIARVFGLHDFYQAGLWNFCEGYNNEGITYCSTPQNLYWFNPVEILLNELLSGSTIAIPNEVTSILDLLRLASHLMFGFFITGTVLTFVLMVLSPLSVRSRWVSLPMAFMSFLTLAFITAASVIGTVISIAFKYAATAQSDLNISASVGIRMFVFMWIATGFSALAFILHSGMGCCCTSRRDIKTGRKPIKHQEKHDDDRRGESNSSGSAGS